jgi:exopolysaccharide production protein ExoZ
MPKLQALQTLRALAASLVVLNHAIGVAAAHGFAKEPYSSLANFFGAQGVAIFFLISGFIMTYTADTTDDSAPPRERALHFATRRIARVVPLYWFFTLLVAAIAALAGFSKALDTTALNLVKSLFFIPYVNAQTVMLPVLPLGWTLNYEMFFYALFAAFLLLPHRRRIPALAATLAVLVVTGSFFYPVLSGNIPHSRGEFLTHPILLLFGAGALLGLLRLRRPELTFRIPGLLPALPLIAINCFVASRAHENPIPMKWDAFFWLLDLGVVALCVFGRPLRAPALEAVGDASYSLYLVHILPLFVCFLVWQRLYFAAPLAFITACLVLSALTALAAYRWLERPLTRAALRLIAPRPAQTVLPPAPVAAPALLEV